VDLDQPPDVGGVQGRVVVPLPADRRPTDWERGTAGLARAAWITADMAYRLRVLEVTGGFDERFPRAYREDADLALRVAARGHRLVHGRRQVSHPVRPAGRWVSVRAQAGNADDALMHRLHGPRWRELAGAPAGGRRRHLVVTGAAALALAGLATGRRRAAAAAAVGWAAGTGRFAWARIGPGPRTVDEVATMLLTSVAIPPAATWHWLRGRWRHRAVRPGAAAVLFDRDGTLIRDVPYNGDPDLVVPMPGAVAAVRALRARGVRLGVITNQSGIARGRLSTAQVEDVNRRVEQIFGPFDVWQLCPHGPGDGCGCRKPAPGMVLAAAAHLGVAPADVVVIGDIGADVDAARAAGARAVLVPTPATRRDEVRRAPVVAADLAHAVQLAVGTVP
jgi:HAD superfamily hydrolase (TIGR01662 family)